MYYISWKVAPFLRRDRVPSKRQQRRLHDSILADMLNQQPRNQTTILLRCMNVQHSKSSNIKIKIKQPYWMMIMLMMIILIAIRNEWLFDSWTRTSRTQELKPLLSVPSWTSRPQASATCWSRRSCSDDWATSSASCRSPPRSAMLQRASGPWLRLGRYLIVFDPVTFGQSNTTSWQNQLYVRSLVNTSQNRCACETVRTRTRLKIILNPNE